MTDWQPIETAPKDGTLILAYERPELPFSPHDRNVPNFPPIDVMWWHGGCWVDGYEVGLRLPSHWMPIPPIPKDAK